MMYSAFFKKELQIAQKLQEMADVSVVLNIWKRNYLNEQLESLYRQTIPLKEIWLIQYENNIQVDKILAKNLNIKWIKCSQNLKYFGRFSFTTFINTQYVWILDDDVIPSNTWLETCIKTCQAYNSIVCSNGITIEEPICYGEKKLSDLKIKFVGVAQYPQPWNYCPCDIQVDYGSSSYFFKTDWIKHFWSIWPVTLETGEDIHLSASCKIQANIPTIVPKQVIKAESGNIKPAYSSDEHASWMKPGFSEQREEVLKYLIKDKSWKPILTQ